MSSAISPVGMFSTCLFCHAALGANEVLERFPLGRRLAFDPSRGRLWVVCPKCRGWNLTPLEIRWEAIEDCERLFRDARMRVSTDQIGLAKLPEGLELVRIGRAERPEFAAWRYGERIVLRRRRNYLQAGLGLGVLGAAVAGGMAAGMGIAGFGWAISQVANAILYGSPTSIIARVRDVDNTELVIRRKHVKHARLHRAEGDVWQLVVPARLPKVKNPPVKFSGKSKKRAALITLQDQEAIRVAGHLLPAMNRFAGSSTSVHSAVTMLSDDPDPARFFAQIASRDPKPPSLAELPVEQRLALEMAAHEETERRALEGELQTLEDAWREAEEIAAISDDMFLPESITAWLRKSRGK